MNFQFHQIYTALVKNGITNTRFEFVLQERKIVTGQFSMQTTKVTLVICCQDTDVEHSLGT